MVYKFENKKINANIKTGEFFRLHGMEDYYLLVTFKYPSRIWNGCVPIKAKYQGVDVPLHDDDVCDWVLKCYEELDPGKNNLWQDSQRKYWAEREAYDTQAVFDALNGDDCLTKWQCRKCGPVPQANPQAGARIKTLRQYGYYIATMKRDCPTCGKKQFFDLLVRLTRRAADNEKRYAISKKLQKKIKTVLPLKDACFGSQHPAAELIIDHKFPSSRWVNGETINENSMTDEEIRNKFQLLTNQTNLQKERYCKRCVLEGIRGDFFGIKWFYSGDEKWQGSSKADQKGCVGCCWYDLEEWKEKFNEYLQGKNNS